MMNATFWLKMVLLHLDRKLSMWNWAPLAEICLGRGEEESAFFHFRGLFCLKRKREVQDQGKAQTERNLVAQNGFVIS